MSGCECFLIVLALLFLCSSSPPPVKLSISVEPHLNNALSLSLSQNLLGPSHAHQIWGFKKETQNNSKKPVHVLINFRFQQEKRYRSMQEHIRRAHPNHYIPKLPATEESFILMVTTPPDQRAHLSSPSQAPSRRNNGGYPLPSSTRLDSI